MTNIQRFQPGNAAARRPRLSETELGQLCQQVQELLDRVRWRDTELDRALGFDPDGRYTHKVLAGRRQPSQTYRARLAVLLALAARGEVQPTPPWAPVLVYQPLQGGVPLRRILAEARQCAECVAEHAEGRRAEADTWWWFGHPRARVCPEHQAAYRRRRAWFAHCLELGCPHVVPAQGLQPPAYTCAQSECALRRQAWRAASHQRAAAQTTLARQRAALGWKIGPPGLAEPTPPAERTPAVAATSTPAGQSPTPVPASPTGAAPEPTAGLFATHPPVRP